MKRRDFKSGRRIVILCEGSTEFIAVKLFIRRQWESIDLAAISLFPIDLRGQVDSVIGKTPLYLKESNVISVFTLIDLCRFKRNLVSGIHDKAERVQAAKSWLLDKMEDHHRANFHPHFAVYEIEAWILAEGEALSRRLQDPSIKARTDAENLDDEKTPKSRLHEIFKRHGRKDGYREIFDGSALFQKMKFESVYCNCPYFRAFFDDLRSVGSQKEI